MLALELIHAMEYAKKYDIRKTRQITINRVYGSWNIL